MAATEAPRPSKFRSTFGDPERLLAAVKGLRAAGYRVLDTYTPFPVHGMDEAIGQRPSRLPRACLAFGILGLASAFALQYWTSAVDYPVRVGGKAPGALPAFLPVMFELTVLFAGLGAVASLLVAARLRPRFKVPDLHPGVNDDRFHLAAEVLAGTSFEQARALLEGAGALETVLLVDDRLRRRDSRWDREVPGWTLGLAFLPAALVLALLPLLNRDFRRRVTTWDAGMATPVSYGSFDGNPALPGGMVLQVPPQGTVSRGAQPPLPFGPATDEAERKVLAERAGQELRNPFPPSQANFLRGKQVFERHCAACHGKEGDNASAIVARGLLAPTILVSPVVRDMPDGRILYTATYGGPKVMKGFGDLIARDDLWKAVLYIRELQRAAAPQARPAAGSPAPGARP